MSIPPPAQPSGGSDKHVLMVPFVLADAPRLQLEYLSKHPAIAPEHRESIRKWLDVYIAKVVEYLRNTHGEVAVEKADTLSKMAAHMMNKHIANEDKKREEEFFAYLEKEMLEDDDE